MAYITLTYEDINTGGYSTRSYLVEYWVNDDDRITERELKKFSSWAEKFEARALLQKQKLGEKLFQALASEDDFFDDTDAIIRYENDVQRYFQYKILAENYANIRDQLQTLLDDMRNQNTYEIEDVQTQY